jgi:hypothetical protein
MSGTDAIRTPDQLVRVFVSFTLGELAAKRWAAREAVAGLRLVPVLFELGARSHPPGRVYRAYLAQSQVFVGIYWQIYGWVAWFAVEAVAGDAGATSPEPRQAAPLMDTLESLVQDGRDLGDRQLSPLLTEQRQALLEQRLRPCQLGRGARVAMLRSRAPGGGEP